jgi:hypothetical protein
LILFNEDQNNFFLTEFFNEDDHNPNHNHNSNFSSIKFIFGNILKIFLEKFDKNFSFDFLDNLIKEFYNYYEENFYSNFIKLDFFGNFEENLKKEKNDEIEQLKRNEVILYLIGYIIENFIEVKKSNQENKENEEYENLIKKKNRRNFKFFN